MRAYIFITLTILGLILFLYGSSLIEQQLYKSQIEQYQNDISFEECQNQFPLKLPVEFVSFTSTAPLEFNYTGPMLALNNLRITSLPDNFFGTADCIRLLELSDNHLTSLPKTIQDIKELKQLLLRNNEIETIPNDFFADFEYLDEVDISQNRLASVHFINTKINQLILSNNRLDSFRCSNSSIKILDLSQNNLRTFPVDILNIDGLHTLDLMSTIIDTLAISKNNKHLLQKSTLENLNLSNTPIRSFPSVLGQLPNLKELNIYACQIEGSLTIEGFPSLPQLRISNQSVDQLILKKNNIEALELVNNQISSVSIEVIQPQLKSINLSDNPLKKLPSSFSNLNQLEQLYLTNIELETPFRVEYLTCQSTLKALNLSSNQINQFPDLSDFDKLSHINFSDNQLKKLPVSNLFNHLQPKSLDLSNNLIVYVDINELDASIEELILSKNGVREITGSEIKENLKTLNLSHNLTLYGLDFDFLDLFPNLTKLNLMQTNIKGTDKEMIINYCKIHDIEVMFDYDYDLPF